MADVDTFGARLRAARTRAGLAQDQLGMAIGVSKSAVSSWENDRDFPSSAILPKLRAVLPTTLDYLVCGIAPEDELRVMGDADCVRETPAQYRATVDDPREVALLERFRALPTKRKDAFLEIMLDRP